MILCLGLASDDTFVHTVLAIKRAGIALHAVDLAQLARSGDVDIPIDDLVSASLTLHGKRYQIGGYRGAWVRLLDIAASAPSEWLERRMSGIHRAVSRLFAVSPIPVVNPPLRDCSNFAKVFHAVSLASLTGWRIPRSCLTSRPTEALEFIVSCEAGVIFKGASGVKTWATRYDPGLHQSRLPLLASCPVLFQERIVGPDVRVHVVGDRGFAELIESSVPDYRTSRRNRHCAIELPATVAAGCAALVRDCGVPFLGVDFKIQRSTGDWFFLEANPAPCYQGYDRRAGGAISRALVDWLVDGPGPVQKPFRECQDKPEPIRVTPPG